MHQMLLGLIVSQSTHSIIRGVGLVTASLSLVRSLDHEQASYIRLRGHREAHSLCQTMVTVCLASVLYGVIARNLLVRLGARVLLIDSGMLAISPISTIAADCR